MLPKEYRLRGFQIPLIVKKGKRYSTSLFNAYIDDCQIREKNFPQFSVVVSLKIDKRATVRNRLKRLFYQVLYDNLKNVRGNKKIVFFVKAIAKQKNFWQIKEEIENFIHGSWKLSKKQF